MTNTQNEILFKEEFRKTLTLESKMNCISRFRKLNISDNKIKKWILEINEELERDNIRLLNEEKVH